MAVKHWELNNPEKVKDKSLARRGNQKIAMQIRQRKYGISIADFKELLETQNNLCAICAGRMIPICVDHDHLTNQVRGLLCRECNSAIGKLKDSPELLRNAIQYLEKAVADTNKQQPNE